MRIVLLSFVFFVSCQGSRQSLERTFPPQSIRDAGGIYELQKNEPESTITITQKSTIIAPPTPAAKALAGWIKSGATMAVVGIVLMLPIFGGNIRTGSLVAAGGVAMGIVGHFLGQMTVTLPVWLFPSVILLAAVGMLYGYHVRSKQVSG
jgi:hypothetical protein